VLPDKATAAICIDPELYRPGRNDSIPILKSLGQPSSPSRHRHFHLNPRFEHAETLNMSHHCFVAPVLKQNEYDSHSEYVQAVDLVTTFMTVDARTESSTNRLDYVIVASTLREMIQSFGLATANSKSCPYIMPT
jgi:hypothetical protein